jgi:homoserine dehydrogenase
MNRINIGLIGYGVVGQGVAQLLLKRKALINNKFNFDFQIKTICDRSIHKKNTKFLKGTTLTTNHEEVLNDPNIHVVVELIGGMHPAKEIVEAALKGGKDVVTANKHLIAHHGRELFKLAQDNNRHLYFESSVGAGIPTIKTITEGIAGNKYTGVFGIINGTCNFILTEMAKNNLSFPKALKEAQEKGYAESNPKLDVSGMDSTHKLAILVYLAFGKFIKVDEIYTEGITHISHEDIELAERMNLCIKLLGIAKKSNDEIEARVHPTLISKNHPLASIHGIYNAVYLKTDPLGNVLLSGEGAGQMAAASGVVSDIINLGFKGHHIKLPCNIYTEATNLKIKPIDEVETKFYLRLMATDKPGVLSHITGILGKHSIGINSVTQSAHNRMAAVPVIMLTETTKEKNLRLALKEIEKMSIIKGKPVAIRMEKLL